MATMVWCFSLFSTLIHLTVLVSGSKVWFDKSPDTIQTILTKYMTLTCKVNDTVTSPSGSLVGRRSVAQTSSDVQFVTSMVVLRDGKEVASITPFTPGTAMQDKDKLTVTGSVAGQHGQGYLTLTWYYPDELQSGNYTCEVNGIGVTGHSVSFSTNLNMPVRNPNMADLTQHVHRQEATIDNLTLTIGHLNNQLANQKVDILAQMEKMLNQSRNEIKTEVAQLVNESMHFENGSVTCGASNTWTRNGGFSSKEMSVQFQEAYNGSPIVHISPAHFDHYDAASRTAIYTNFMIELVNVTQTEFTVRCKTRYQPNNYYYLNNFDLSWISLP